MFGENAHLFSFNYDKEDVIYIIVFLYFTYF